MRRTTLRKCYLCAAVLALPLLLLLAPVSFADDADDSRDDDSSRAWRGELWPKIGAIRGWAFAYNFTNTTLYPQGTVNLYAGLNPQAESWDTKHGIGGYEALLKAQAMADRRILPLMWEYCWNSPYPKSAERNATSVLNYFAKNTFPFPWVAGTAVDECNKAEVGYSGERTLAAQGFRAAKARNPGKLLAGWGANTGDELFASLMADGTFDLALVEGYTYCAEAHGDWPAKADVCANKGTPHVEQYFDRLDYARQKGYINRTVFTFGFMLGASDINPNAWTATMLREAMVKVKTAYPEMPGVMMFGRSPRQGFANASNFSTPQTEQATLEIIQVANKLMLELYPDH